MHGSTNNVASIVFRHIRTIQTGFSQSFPTTKAQHQRSCSRQATSAHASFTPAISFSSRSTRFVCYFLLVLLIPVLCWSVFAGTFLCTPVAKLWKPHLPGHCMNPRQYWLSAAAINIGMDFTVLLLPLPAITQLRLPRKQKLCLILMFLLGFFVCVVSVVRLAVVNFLESSGRLVGKSHPQNPNLPVLQTNTIIRIRHPSSNLVSCRSEHRHHLRLTHRPETPLTALLPAPAQRH